MTAKKPLTPAQKQDLVNKYMNTAEGRAKIAAAMAAPLRAGMPKRRTPGLMSHAHWMDCFSGRFPSKNSGRHPWPTKRRGCIVVEMIQKEPTWFELFSREHA